MKNLVRKKEAANLLEQPIRILKVIEHVEWNVWEETGSEAGRLDHCHCHSVRDQTVDKARQTSIIGSVFSHYLENHENREFCTLLIWVWKTPRIYSKTWKTWDFEGKTRNFQNIILIDAMIHSLLQIYDFDSFNQTKSLCSVVFVHIIY